MTELSPAARAILEAATNTPYDMPYEHDLAAALRAAVDQVVPEENVDDADYDCLHAKWAADGKQEVRSSFLAIANELEAQ